MEEVALLKLNYSELCTLLESGTVGPSTLLHKKLKAARDTFLRQPKVYGNGIKLVRASDEMVG